MDLTPDQIRQLESLGISVSKSPQNVSESATIPSEEIKTYHISSPTSGNIIDQTTSSNETNKLLKPSINPIVPLLSISGLTLISFGGIVLFKNKNQSLPITDYQSPVTNLQPSPSQVPKSIQHYLLTSQQLFTKALSLQSTVPADQRTSEMSDALNQSILAATNAIKEFPDDYRGYDQRGRIYQSLADSNLPAGRQAPFLQNAIADLTAAYRLNPNSVEIARTLATLFAKSGDAPHTLAYLSQTINLDPTNPQNFYDLARLQVQAGYIPEALTTYSRLLTLIADPAQKKQVETEKASLENLVAQNPNVKANPRISPSLPSIAPTTDGPLLQADSGAAGLIIAAPETSKDISINNLTSSNSLAGTATLPANTKSISLTNSQLTPTSQVYLSVTKGGKNQVLQVISRSGTNFEVGLDSPIAEPIEFKWWIVNN